MSEFAINGIRIDDQSGRVTHVRWAPVNPQQNAWMSEPDIAPVIEVGDAIVGGDHVWTIYPEGVNTVLGPPVRTVVYGGGFEGIETVEDPNGPRRTLADLPRV